MGYSLFWLAVKGKALGDLSALLELKETGETEEIPESDIVSAQLPTGWNLVLWNKGDLPTQQDFERASANCEALFCFVEEHVMSSLCEGWNNGSLKWSVRHNARWNRGQLFESDLRPPKRFKTIEVDGIPPDPFSEIRVRLEAKRAEHNATNPPRNHRVDFIFDIPVDLAEALTGFRHDKDVPGVTFNCVKSSATKRVFKPQPSFLRRIFGS